MSRRLQHYKENYRFYVGSTEANVPQIIYETVDRCVHLEHKKVHKGHTLGADLKRIEKEIIVENTTRDGIWICLKLHVHHYSKVYFDIQHFLTHLAAELKLPFGKVTLVRTHEANTTPCSNTRQNGALTN